MWDGNTSRDGWDVLQSLRGHPQTREVPVIVCTLLRQRALALALGATDFLTKPVTWEARGGSAHLRGVIAELGT